MEAKVIALKASTPGGDRLLLWITLFVLLVLNSFSCVFYFQGDIVFYQENHYLENVQAVSFFVGFAVLFVASFWVMYVKRWLISFFGAVCLLCFLREVEFDSIEGIEAIADYLTGKKRNMIMSALFLLLLLWGTARYRKELKPQKDLLLSKSAYLVYVGGALLLLGDLFEKYDSKIIEEVLEMNGAVAICYAAIYTATHPSSLVTQYRFPRKKNIL